MCDCQEIEQQQYLDYHNQYEYEEEEETIRPPLPPCARSTGRGGRSRVWRVVLLPHGR